MTQYEDIVVGGLAEAGPPLLGLVFVALSYRGWHKRFAAQGGDDGVTRSPATHEPPGPTRGGDASTYAASLYWPRVTSSVKLVVAA